MSSAVGSDLTTVKRRAAGEQLETQIDGQFLFETVISDLHWTATQIGMIACLLSACAQPSATWTLRSRRHLMHDNAVIMCLGLRYFEDIGIGRDVMSKIEETYVLLQTIMQGIDPGLFAATQYTHAQKQAVAVLAADWRPLVKTASTALAVSEPVVRARLPEVYVSNGKVLGSFLSEVLEGRKRRINEFGEIEMPRLAQRRRTPRHAISQGCHIEARGRVVHATIVNASRGGVGVKCDFVFSVDEPVMVALRDGRRLRARVARQDANQVGLAFVALLDLADPLFARAEVAPRLSVSRRPS